MSEAGRHRGGESLGAISEISVAGKGESSRPGELHPQALTDSGLERLRSSGSYRPVAARRSNGQ